VFFCSCCSAPLVGDHRAHYLQCELARGITRKFSRKDHLLNHLQKHHGLRNMGEHTRTWSLPVDSDWPRQCGFCGDIFYFWEERMAHVSRHFEQGLKILDWKFPFLGPKDPKPPGLFFANHRKDEDEDEDDDDGFGGGGAGRTSRGLASCYGPTSSIPDATAQHGESSSSQQYGTYPGGNYQCQSNAVDGSDPASVLEVDIKIFSSKDAECINATAQFDSGTSDNWISAALVERLRLSIYESPFNAYKTLRGRAIQSSDFVLGVNWTTVDGLKFFKVDFQVVTQDVSFEILIGMQFMRSVDKIDSVFNIRRRSQDPSHKRNCQLWRPFKTSLDLETYLNKYVECQEEFRDRKATRRPFKPNVALERYLNDPADRVQGLSALRQISSQQRKQEWRRDPRTVTKTFLKHGTDVVLPRDFRISFSAQQYIHEHWDDLDHGVLWVNSKIHPDIKSSLLEIAAHLVIVRYLDGDSMMTSLLHRLWQNNIQHSLCQLPPLDQGAVSNDATNYFLYTYAMYTPEKRRQRVPVPPAAHYGEERYYYPSDQVYTNDAGAYAPELRLDENQVPSQDLLCTSSSSANQYDQPADHGYYRPQSPIQQYVVQQHDSTSFTTARWYREPTPEERLRLGLSRHVTQAEVETARRVYGDAMQQADRYLKNAILKIVSDMAVSH